MKKVFFQLLSFLVFTILLSSTSYAQQSVATLNSILPPKGDLNGPTSSQTVSGTIPVWGWFVDGSGVAKIEVLVDGVLKGTATTGLLRPDVLSVYPAYANANGGYEYKLDTTKLKNGAHQIVIRETSGKNIQTSLAARSITVSNPSVLPPRGDLNGPVSSQTVSGILPVWGWFVDGSGVSKIEVLVDGVPKGTATTGLLRPDVLNVYPAYANANSGYEYKLDTTKLTNGTHKIVIRETSSKNIQTSLSARSITISNASVLPPKGDLNGPLSSQTVSGTIPVWGWFVDGNVVAKIEVLVDGTAVGTATTGLLRPDVLNVYPAYANANSGYEYKLNTTKLTNGTHKIVIRETSSKNVQASLAARSITVSNPSVLPPKGDLNGPLSSQTVSGILPVWGWFVDGNGVSKIEVLVDGAAFGTATTGLLRQDVLNVYPSYANANSGYEYKLDTTKLTNGTHKIVIRETSDKNVQTSLAARSVIVSNANGSAPGKLIVGYYAGWAAYSGYTPANIPADKLTHINYAFANVSADLKIVMGDPTVDPGNFVKLNALKQANPSLKTLISIGGWEWSGRFSDVALTDQSRTIFADSVVSFLKQYGFDGLDIDWEYPVGGGLAANKYRSEDKHNFTLLLQKLREKFDAQTDGKQYLLTIAGGAGNLYASNVELSSIAPYLDFANLMTYDIHGPWETYTDFNAPLYATKAASPQSKWGANDAVKLWKSKGFPADKIVLGMPFYAYSYTDVQNGGNGLYKTYLKGKSVPYDKLVSDFLSNPAYTRYFDADSHASWLFNGSAMITFDDVQSLKEKADYINANALAGAMIWELSQNRNGELLGAIYNELN